MDEQAITIRLPKQLYYRLRRVAFDREVPMNAIVTDAVKTALDAESDETEGGK